MSSGGGLLFKGCGVLLGEMEVLGIGGGDGPPT